MDEEVLRMATEEVLDELNMSGRRFTIETAMAAPNSESIQIRLYDRDGTDKAVVVDLKDKNGLEVIYIDEIKNRIRKQLETFAETTDD